MQRVGLIGYPVKHSVSPAMHTAAFKALGIEGQYDLLPCPPAALATQVRTWVEAGYTGFNVTIPHKKAVLELADTLDPDVKAIGATNTLTVTEGGSLHASNTDWRGFTDDLRAKGVTVKGQQALILGTGGAAQAIHYALTQMEAYSVTFVSREPPVRPDIIYYQELEDDKRAFFIEEVDLIVNCTPVGMTVAGSPWPERASFPKDAVIYDLIYNPPTTPLMEQAHAAGLPAYNGLGMLVRQAAHSFTLWTGKEPPIETMQQAANNTLSERTTMTDDSLIEELEWRGLLNQMTEGADEALKEKNVTAYIGFDPTADSLHVGSLVPIMALVHLQRHGHTPIALVGGGTGMIGDPSGKSEERNLLDDETLAHNQAGIRAQLEQFLDFEGVDNPAVMLNNADWLRHLNLIDFLRDTGKHFTVNYMMAKDSVKSRLASEVGISFTEFSYMLLQAFDFLTMYRSHDCTFQLGGSDQWGNITAGATLIRRVESGDAHGITLPLVTTASGQKFGKTAKGTVWLDPKRTSPFRFYQFWINTADDDVIDYLKYFTLLDREEIEALEKATADEPWKRAAQQKLAEEMTRMVHGEEALLRAQRATNILFGDGDLEGLSAAEVEEIFSEVPSTEVEASVFEGEGKPVVDLVKETGLERSKKQTRQLIDNGGMYVNNERVESTDAALTTADAIDGEIIVLRKGKKSYHLVRLT